MPLLVTGAVTRAQSVCVGGFGVSHQLVLLMSTCPSVPPAEVLGGFGAFCDAAREGLGCPHGQLGIPLSQTYHLLSSPRQFRYSSSLPCFRKLVTKNNNNNPFTKVVMGLKDGAGALESKERGSWSRQKGWHRVKDSPVLAHTSVGSFFVLFRSPPKNASSTPALF